MLEAKSTRMNVIFTLSDDDVSRLTGDEDVAVTAPRHKMAPVGSHL